ncbi:MAG: peptidase M23 [Blastochloris viridis]|uniref:Peptidase M23 n=1 Tax=Blastochloris viridis TaxID=1079 RepID=A0A6N4RBG2_BLAVI|nr:MAG: peptidase M23 [Blastochloris viridis]
MALSRTLAIGGLICSGYLAVNLASTEQAIATLRIPSDATAANSAQTLPQLEIQRTIMMKRGDTLASTLKKAGFSPEQIAAMTISTPSATKPITHKTEMKLSYTESAPYQIQTASLTYRPKPEEEVTLKLNGTQATAKAVAKPLQEINGTAVGEIHDSLYQDATQAGLSPAQVMQFMNLFAWDLDYTRDIHPGDTFKVLYEKTVNDKGVTVKTGKILAAEFTVAGETRSAYFYAGEYLNEKGESKKKLLLRTPLEFTRISSNFDLHRKHPVLGFTRAHKGTDFAAPTGTPVKASGDGKVVYVGPHGGHGNFVKIEHNGTFTTAYAHLSRFAKGLKVGQRVKQGQVIAFVGSTGVSSGPHLHYEVIKNGTHVNAMSTDLPTGSPLSKKQLAEFKRHVSNAQTAWNAAFLQNRQVASR